MMGWKRRARRAEAMLMRQTSSRIDLVLRVNGEYVETYTFNAIRLESASESISAYPTWASGDGAVFTLDIPVVVGVIPNGKGVDQ